MTEDTRPNPRAKRRWYQFRLRALLLLMAAFALWLGIKVHRVRQQEEAIQAVLDLGGTVYYDYQLEQDSYGRTTIDREAPPSGPAWLRAVVGEEYFREVTDVSLRDTKASDAELELLAKLPGLQSLDLANSPVSSDGLVHLRGLRKLRALSLCNTDVDDSGMKHIGRLTGLQRLSLWNTKVGDDGLEQLSGLTDMRNLVLDGTDVSDEGLKHLQGMADLEEWLGLTDTQVTDAGLHNLKHLSKLEQLNLLKTQVTPAGVKALKKHLPNTSISGGGNVGL
jgi:hypothetical protein